MSDYDFSTLNDKDFEELTVDLLTAEFNERIERFKPGRDGGVDGRFFGTDGKERIIQCKHWLKSGINTLITSLTNTELPKVKKLNPQKYFLVTSLSLSRKNKQDIKYIFSDYMELDSQILGKEDINDLLKKHSSVEQNHYKLWISSTTVLKSILNSDIIGTSKYKLEEINNDSTKYVITENHRSAIRILEKNHILIISGSPGIGKTTLADQICKHYLVKGFEFYYIDNDIRSVEKVYEDEKKQIFYFDDFLGSNYLEAIKNKEDTKIVSLIKRMEKNPNKRFILTSRTNILNQGKCLSSAFENQNISKNQYELIIENLKSLDKAKILYNHIYFSDLDNEFIDEFYIDKRYKQIIDHKNYNPRMISFITDSQRLSKIEKDKYWSYIQSILDDPSQIWDHVFNTQIINLHKDIIIMIVLHGNVILEKQLEEIYYKLCSDKYDNKHTFAFVMKALTGSLLNRISSVNNEISYTLFNPSIADYIAENYFSNKLHLFELIKLTSDIKVLQNLIDLEKNKNISKNNISYIFKQILSIDHIDAFWSRFSLISLSKYLDTSEIANIFCNTKDQFFKNKNYSVQSFKFMLYLIQNDILRNDGNFFKIDYEEVIGIFVESDDYYDLSNLSQILNILQINENTEIFTKLNNQIFEYFSECITSMIIEDNILTNISHSVDEEYNFEYVYEDEAYEYINSIMSEEFPTIKQEVYYEIVNCIDIDEVSQANMNSMYSDHYEKDSSSNNFMGLLNHVDPITDLFDRS
ncbi:ATP-binding protein [Acinetobacter nectaris]|uniref:ATP-binding protein n=1 Tax=Acinetobacter nectaris TaxID=1219382 RepID=UPI001EFF71A5|nr:ATP-binding protein [Acinetobacter nectaris]MCF9047473.1 restriction endonuclease [Acinetobacter nectaris]